MNVVVGRLGVLKKEVIRKKWLLTWCQTIPPNIQPWMVKSDDGNDVDHEESEFNQEMAEEDQ